jgi:hypothetical protein
MDQFSFLSALEPKRTEAAPLTKMELLAAGLKAQRMGAVDREEFLTHQIEKINERRRNECD